MKAKGVSNGSHYGWINTSVEKKNLYMIGEHGGSWVVGHWVAGILVIYGAYRF